MAATDDGHALLGGTPGGDNQVPWNTQLLQGVFDGEREPGRLVTAPRWEWLPSDDGVRVEDGFDRDHLDRLADAASRVVRVGRWALPCAQQVIARQGAGQAIVGAADPRTVGLALGV
jgi:gamma-glutamyltranspeptidase/glutathione hydrolase